MLPFTQQIDNLTIWLVLGCLYMNGFMGAFAHILNPAIQADIRDYQQYKTGERIDGMFSAVATIGTVITLLTSSVLPAIYEKGGITRENAVAVTSDPNVLSRMLGDGKTVGTILAEQFANGQDNYSNAYSALYDLDILSSLLHVLIIISAVGALMNVIPFFWYDFNERKQKSVVRVLKVRAMFEDYGNNALSDKDIVEAVDLVKNSREMAAAAPKTVDKKSYKSISDKAKRKEAKKLYREALEFNEEIEISKFVCDELDKFSKPFYKDYMARCRKVYDAGLEGLRSMDINDINREISEAKAMPKKTAQDKEVRSMYVDMAKNKKYALKAIKKYYSHGEAFVKPDFAVLEGYYEAEDKCNEELKALYAKQSATRKAKDYAQFGAIKDEIKLLEAKKKEIVKLGKLESDKIANFSSAAKPYVDAETKLKQMENYTHFSEIAEQYADAKARYEAAEAEKEAQRIKLEQEEKEYAAKIKAEKKNKKNK